MAAESCNIIPFVIKVGYILRGVVTDELSSVSRVLAAEMWRPTWGLGSPAAIARILTFELLTELSCWAPSRTWLEWEQVEKVSCCALLCSSRAYLLTFVLLPPATLIVCGLFASVKLSRQFQVKAVGPAFIKKRPCLWVVVLWKLPIAGQNPTSA